MIARETLKSIKKNFATAIIKNDVKIYKLIDEYTGECEEYDNIEKNTPVCSVIDIYFSIRKTKNNKYQLFSLDSGKQKEYYSDEFTVEYVTPDKEILHIKINEPSKYSDINGFVYDIANYPELAFLNHPGGEIYLGGQEVSPVAMVVKRNSVNVGNYGINRIYEVWSEETLAEFKKTLQNLENTFPG